MRRVIIYGGVADERTGIARRDSKAPDGGTEAAAYALARSMSKQTEAETAHPLTALLELATDMGVADLATNHDRYAHGKLGER